jgi:hypothetical protein
VGGGGNLVYLHRMADVPIARIRSAIRCGWGRCQL